MESMIRKLFIILIVVSMGCVPTNSVYGEQNITLVEHNNMHFINVTFNGKKTKLLVDTGASKSLIDINKAEEYGFSYAMLSRQQYVGLGGLLDIYVVYDYQLTGPHITFLGADLTDINYYFNKEGIEIIGILGSDFLERNEATIDFKTNILQYDPR
jgi:hypothetical protein